MRRLVIILVLIIILCGGCKGRLITLEIPGSTAQILMRLIPAGTFNMGSPDWEVDRESDEGPRHLVTITKPFYMGVYEVTQEQWEAIMMINPSHFSASNNPVESITWWDCQEFISKLNTKCIGTFRLPTEAEWEYACRSGTSTRFAFGDDFDYSKLGDYAWYHGNSLATLHAVGQKEPNAWGLYDMYGNVWEWCSDRYGTYDSRWQTDPQGPTIGSSRVLRGSSWSNYSQYCRTANRYNTAPTDLSYYMGFRLVMTAPQSMSIETATYHMPLPGREGDSLSSMNM